MGAYMGKSTSMRELLAILRAGLEHKVPVVMEGKPGIGKTELVKALARATGYEVYILLGSVMDPSDVNGLPTISMWEHIDKDGVSRQIPITTYALNGWAQELLTKREVILFLDELNNAVPAVQSVLLSIVQDRKVGNITLPDEVWIIAAMNAAEDAADGWVLSPPMANRFLHVKHEIDVDDWVNGMLVNWNDQLPEDASEKERTKFAKISTQRAEIAGFISQYPNHLIEMPDNRDDAGGAWPSPRSWDNAARLLSSIPKHESTMSIRDRALVGLVGEAVAQQYRVYENSIRLPDYNEVLRDPSSIKWDNLSTAEVKLTLDMVLNRMSVDNFTASMEVFAWYAENDARVEVLASMYNDIAISMMHKGPNLREELKMFQLRIAKPLQPALKAAGLTASDS